MRALLQIMLGLLVFVVIGTIIYLLETYTTVIFMEYMAVGAFVIFVSWFILELWETRNKG